MLRKIIKINSELCNGCGKCIPNCPEGALQIIDGKARLISDLCCDGLGACIGECPLGAIEIEEREAQPYNEHQVMLNIAKQGENVIKAHLKHLRDHKEFDLYEIAIQTLKELNISIPDLKPNPALHQNCPGMMSRLIHTNSNIEESNYCHEISSELSHWPIQLKLINPSAPWFDNKKLLICADCVPFSFGNFHKQFLKGCNLIMFCPKLDGSKEEYIVKLAEIFKNHCIPSIKIVRMEVPCCGGVTNIVNEALTISGKKIPISTEIITIDGKIK